MNTQPEISYDLDTRLLSLNSLARTAYRFGNRTYAMFFLDMAKDMITKSMNPEKVLAITNCQFSGVDMYVPATEEEQLASYRDAVLG